MAKIQDSGVGFLIALRGMMLDIYGPTKAITGEGKGKNHLQNGSPRAREEILGEEIK